MDESFFRVWAGLQGSCPWCERFHLLVDVRRTDSSGLWIKKVWPGRLWEQSPVSGRPRCPASHGMHYLVLLLGASPFGRYCGRTKSKPSRLVTAGQKRVVDSDAEEDHVTRLKGRPDVLVQVSSTNDLSRCLYQSICDPVPYSDEENEIRVLCNCPHNPVITNGIRDKT